MDSRTDLRRLPIHVATAGITVFDGANTSPTTINSKRRGQTKQVEQYKIQLQQCQNMLQNTAAPAAYIWNQTDQTISKPITAQDTLSNHSAAIALRQAAV
ncbi:hypothetical protein [Pseudomonas umsongensis]|uniref:hypothetical protein n=1 Tax=Pseudomonas umsongensis TaxID=198618 RepID=UPI003D7FE84F